MNEVLDEDTVEIILAIPTDEYDDPGVDITDMKCSAPSMHIRA